MIGKNKMLSIKKTSLTHQLVLEAPLGNDRAKYIAAGSSHTCAILSNDTIKCWGYNGSGQTGGGTQNDNGTLTLSGTAGSPLGSDKVKYIAEGSCAILSNDTVKCWGRNEFGQTGGGTQNDNGTLTLSGTAGSPLGSDRVKDIAAEYAHTCAILSNDTIKCWGENEDGQTGRGGYLK